MTEPTPRLFDPTTRVFSADVRAELQIRLQNGAYAATYDLLSDTLLSIDPQTGERYIAADPSMHQAQLFFDGAAEVNEGVGVFSAWIRTYTQAQGVLRQGTLFSSEEMQRASDGVARNVMGDLPQGYALHLITDIADRDALGKRGVLFPELGDKSPAWSGVILYSLFG